MLDSEYDKKIPNSSRIQRNYSLNYHLPPQNCCQLVQGYDSDQATPIKQYKQKKQTIDLHNY